MNTNNKEALTFDGIKKIILDSGVLDEHDKNVGGDLYSPKGNQELTADALAQYIAPRLLQDNEDTEVKDIAVKDEHACTNNDYCPVHPLKQKPSSKVEKLKELRSQLNKFPVKKKETWMYEVISLLTDVLIEDEE